MPRAQKGNSKAQRGSARGRGNPSRRRRDEQEGGSDGPEGHGSGDDEGGNSSSPPPKSKVQLPRLPAPAGVPQLPSELATFEREALTGIRERHWRSSKRLTDQVPPVTMERYKALTALVDDPLWQPADTANLEQETQAHVDFLAERPKNTDLDQLWRLAPRFMGCLPPALLEGRNLAYEAAGKYVTIGGAVACNPIWSPSFCNALRQLVVHPFFLGSPALLAVVLQYATKLRTNDRRRWPLENPTSEAFLDEMAAAFGSPHPTRTTRELHTDVCKTMERRGKIRPAISHLFRELETTVAIPATLSGASSSPFAPYPVGAADVKAVVQALGDLHIRGAPAFSSPHGNFRWVRSGLRSDDPPHGSYGVTVAMQDAYKRSVQALILEQRRPPPPQPLPAPSSSATAMGSGPEANLLESRAEIERLRSEIRRLNAQLQKQSPFEAESERGDERPWDDDGPLPRDDSDSPLASESEPVATPAGRVAVPTAATWRDAPYVTLPSKKTLPQASSDLLLSAARLIIL